MKQARLLCISLLLAATLWPAAAHAVGRVETWHVKNLLPGPRVCTPGASGIYSYNASCGPASWDGQPVQRYNVAAHNCVAGPVRCTLSQCNVTATGCGTSQPGAWIEVQADVDKAISGVRKAAAPPSRCT